MRWPPRLSRKHPAWLYVALFSLLSSALLTALTGIPFPETHDEFSYLLAADTFAHGHLTNPPHPLWEYFESFHILQQPTYQSKYQPGQGLILALGQFTTGEPITGAWLFTALACAAITWALQPLLARRWALLVGLLTSLHPVILLWSQNYWGGSLAILGGALVFGSAVRLRSKPTTTHAALLALGIVVLFNTRPYEGLVLCILTLTPLLLRLPHLRPSALLTLIALLLLGAAWSGYYNYRVTGSPWRLPYVEYEAQYGLAPLFIGQPVPPDKPLRHPSMREFKEQAELAPALRQRTLPGFLAESAHKLWTLAKAFAQQPILLLPLLAIPFLLRQRRYLRLVAIAAVLFLAALLLPTWTFAHYAAPGIILLVALSAAVLRTLLLRSPRLFWPFIAVYLATTVWWTVDRVRTLPTSWGAMRQSLINELLQDPGDDLVLVRNLPGRPLHTEWVYNPASIDTSPVIFARDTGRNRPLLEYFAARKTWLLEVGPAGPTIRAYEPRPHP